MNNPQHYWLVKFPIFLVESTHDIQFTINFINLLILLIKSPQFTLRESNHGNGRFTIYL